MTRLIISFLLLSSFASAETLVIGGDGNSSATGLSGMFMVISLVVSALMTNAIQYYYSKNLELKTLENELNDIERKLEEMRLGSLKYDNLGVQND